jgi:hypothetical protein
VLMRKVSLEGPVHCVARYGTPASAASACTRTNTLHCDRCRAHTCILDLYVDGPASSALGSSASPAAVAQWQSRPPAQGPGARQELRDPMQRSCPPSPSLGSVNSSLSHANGPGPGNGWYGAQGGSAFLAMYVRRSGSVSAQRLRCSVQRRPHR